MRGGGECARVGLQGVLNISVVPSQRSPRGIVVVSQGIEPPNLCVWTFVGHLVRQVSLWLVRSLLETAPQFHEKPPRKGTNRESFRGFVIDLSIPPPLPQTCQRHFFVFSLKNILFLFQLFRFICCPFVSSVFWCARRLFFTREPCMLCAGQNLCYPVAVGFRNRVLSDDQPSSAEVNPSFGDENKNMQHIGSVSTLHSGLGSR